MKLMHAVYVRSLLVLISLGLLGACAAYRPQMPFFQPEEQHRVVSVEQEVTVSGAALSAEQAKARFGVNLASVRIRAIWLRVENNSPNSVRFLFAAMDPEYRAPDEVAELFHPLLNSEGDLALTKALRDAALPVVTCAGCVTEGYVFTPLHEGGRFISAHLLGLHKVYDLGFVVTTPDGDFDYETNHPEKIYGTHELEDYSLQEGLKALKSLPCCVANEQGEHRGDPLNLVMVGEQEAIMAALARAGWSFTHRITADSIWRLITSTLMGTPYAVAPVSSLYLWERPQDLALQRARNTIVQRNHLRLWLALWTWEGQSVWVGQVSRDITVKTTSLSPTLTTHVIDPDIDEAREHLFQSKLVAGVIARYGFVNVGEPVLESEPRYNLTEDPYFTDGRFLVAEVVHGISVPPDEAVRITD